jgi:hypothetical protein
MHRHPSLQRMQSTTGTPFDQRTQSEYSPTPDGDDYALQPPPPAVISQAAAPWRHSDTQPLGNQDSSRNLFVNTAAAAHLTPRPGYVAEPQWEMPIHDMTRQHSSDDDASPEEFPFRRLGHVTPDDARRGSDASDMTLNEGFANKDDPYAKYSFSSYQHPYDIRPPQIAYSGAGDSSMQPSQRPVPRRGVSFSEERPVVCEYIPDEDEEDLDPEAERALKRRGVPSNMLDLYAFNAGNEDIEGQPRIRRRASNADSDAYAYTSARDFMRRRDSAASTASAGSDMLDPDDPRVTGVKARYLEDPEDIEKYTLRKMDYRSRRKHRRRVKIEFNVSCMRYSLSAFYQFSRHDFSHDQQTGIPDYACESTHDLRGTIT